MSNERTHTVMCPPISFFVAGIPQPKGSAKAFWHTSAKKIVVMQDNAERQRPWASAIAVGAKQAGLKSVEGPVWVGMTFYMPRPQSHYRKGGTALRASAPAEPFVKPDLDKLIRCVLDALTGIAYRDDAQVCKMIPSPGKLYAIRYPGVWISVTQRTEFVAWPPRPPGKWRALDVGRYQHGGASIALYDCGTRHVVRTGE